MVSSSYHLFHDNYPMRLFRMLNVVNVQCRGYYDDFSMNVFNIVIALMVQRRRCYAIFQWLYLPLWMFSTHNIVCIVMIIRWMCLILRLHSWCNAVGLVPLFRWIYFPLWMFPIHNVVCIVMIIRWMCLILRLRSWCNAVGVVLLIARGWRGTSLPRVSIHKGIQRHRCWAFSMMAWL